MAKRKTKKRAKKSLRPKTSKRSVRSSRKRRSKRTRKSLIKKEEKLKKVKIRVIGIGGGGSSIVSELASRMKKISFVVANTDLQALKTTSRKALRFQFGQEVTKGFGTGMNASLGREAALKAKEKIKKLLEGFDFCILVVCLGGGTGSGAGPIFAKISQELGNITYGIFTLPFKFEGERKMEIAKNALRKLRPKLDIFSIIPNERIFRIIDKKTPLRKALSSINENLTEGLEGLIEVIYAPGLINIDFADFKTILSDFRAPLVKTGGKLAYLNTVTVGRKKSTVKDLIEKVLNNPLYSYGILGAKGVLLNIAGERDLSLNEVSQISKTISNLVNKEAKIIFGISQKKRYSGLIKTTLLATGLSARIFSSKPRKKTKKKRIILKPPQAPLSPPAKKEVPKIVSKKPKKRKPKKRKPKKIRRPKKSKKQKKKAGSSSRVKIKVFKEKKEQGKIRKTALQIKKEMEAEEKEMLEKEKFWESPAFLRKKLAKDKEI